MERGRGFSGQRAQRVRKNEQTLNHNNRFITLRTLLWCDLVFATFDKQLERTFLSVLEPGSPNNFKT